jgi:putative aldouronate transport system substrate-binding protein
MTFKTQRLFYTGMAVMLMLSFTHACGRSTEDAETSDIKTEGLEEEIADDIIPITFTALVTDATNTLEWGDDPISQEITRRTGVSLKFETLVGDMDERISVMLASQNYPDLLLSITHDNVQAFAEAGHLVSFDEYIQSNDTHIEEIFTEYLDLMRNPSDGKIYGFNRNYNELSYEPASQFWICYDVLKEFNYPKINTLDELQELLEEYVERHPYINGNAVIPMSAWGDSWGFNISFNNTAMSACGYQDDGNWYISNDYDVQYALTTEDSKQYFRWLSGMNRLGLFDKEALVQTRELLVSKVKSGSVLCITTAAWDISEINKTMIEAGMPERQFAPIPLYISEEVAQNSKINNYDPTGSWKSVITDNCKDAERAIEFFNQMWSEEMQILVNWGIEGEHYDVINGKRVMKQEVLDLVATDSKWSEKLGISKYSYWSMGAEAKDSTGNYIKPFENTDMLEDLYDEETKVVLGKYGITNWSQLNPKAEKSERGFAWTLELPSDTPGKAAQDECDDIIRRISIPKLILAKSEEDFEKEWEKFKKAVYEAGIELREEEVENALKTRLEFWGSMITNE